MVGPIGCLLKYTTIQASSFHYVDMNDLDNITAVLNENTKMIWVETPTNPLMKLAMLLQLQHFPKKHTSRGDNICFSLFTKATRFRS
jgi:cystathionine beta-lyase